MDGFRMDTTGEVDLELTNHEAHAMLVSIVHTLSVFSVYGCPLTRQHLIDMKHTLEQLGVQL